VKAFLKKKEGQGAWVTSIETWSQPNRALVDRNRTPVSRKKSHKQGFPTKDYWRCLEQLKCRGVSEVGWQYAMETYSSDKGLRKSYEILINYTY
jgi:hypothetical protein